MPHIEVKLEAIPVDKPLRLEHAGRAVVVIRSADRITAFPDSCPHARWRLSDGEVTDGILECPGHGWEFDVTTGACLTVPAYCLKPLAVCIETDCVRIELQQSDFASRRCDPASQILASQSRELEIAKPVPA